MEGHDLGLTEAQCWHFLGGNEEIGESLRIPDYSVEM